MYVAGDDYFIIFMLHEWVCEKIRAIKSVPDLSHAQQEVCTCQKSEAIIENNNVHNTHNVYI
jgi:hypothetical protein